MVPTKTPLSLNIPESANHIRDGWVNNYFPSIKTFQNNSQLTIGGWGDTYLSLLKFDVEGLPTQVDNAYLYLYSLPRGGTTQPSQVALFPATSPWSTTVQWGDTNKSGVFEPYSSVFPSTLPTLGSGYSYSPSPGVNTWYIMWITPFYNGWKNDATINHGLVVYPIDGTNNQFDYFVSSDSTDDGKRPILRLDFTPTLELKMPFNGLRWAVTTEIGGVGCSYVHTGHQGNGYFSIDFSWKARDANGNLVYSSSTANIPILAATGGTVVSGAPTGGGDQIQSTSAGYFVRIQHQNTGITTGYLHLKASPLVRVGDTVAQGKLLGYMGNTPTNLGMGVHLDFNVQYNGSGTSDKAQLAKVIMDNWILKSFQVDGCTTSGESIRYYPSSNVMVP